MAAAKKTPAQPVQIAQAPLLLEEETMVDFLVRVWGTVGHEAAAKRMKLHIRMVELDVQHGIARSALELGERGIKAVERIADSLERIAYSLAKTSGPSGSVVSVPSEPPGHG